MIRTSKVPNHSVQKKVVFKSPQVLRHSPVKVRPVLSSSVQLYTLSTIPRLYSALTKFWAPMTWTQSTCGHHLFSPHCFHQPPRTTQRAREDDTSISVHLHTNFTISALTLRSNPCPACLSPYILKSLNHMLPKAETTSVILATWECDFKKER